MNCASWYSVTEVRKHPKYYYEEKPDFRFTVMRNDIGVIVTDRPIAFNCSGEQSVMHVRPIYNHVHLTINTTVY